MTFARSIFVAALLAFTPMLSAQEEKPASRPSRPKEAKRVMEPSSANRLVSAIDTILPQEEEVGDIARLATDVKRRMERVDTKALGALEERLSALETEETSVRAKMEDWKAGRPLDLEPWWDVNDASTRCDKATVELEEISLLAMKTKFEEAKETRKKDIERIRAETAAKETGRSAEALLGTLDVIPPPPPEAPKKELLVKTQFPDRLARALFKADDYVGALAQFRTMKPEDLLESDRFAIARCLEETGDVRAAIAELDTLLGGVKSGFWKERATNLKKYLERRLTISGALK